MVTGEIKNRIDQIWDIFWTGGISNSITILEQMTYLFFMKMLDDAEQQREADASAWGMEVDEPVFPKGEWTTRVIAPAYADDVWSVLELKNSSGCKAKV